MEAISTAKKCHVLNYYSNNTISITVLQYLNDNTEINTDIELGFGSGSRLFDDKNCPSVIVYLE